MPTRVAHLGEVGRVLVKVLRQQQGLVDASATRGGFAEVSGSALSGKGLRETRLHAFLCAGERVVDGARVAKVGFHSLASYNGDGVLGGGQRDRETSPTHLFPQDMNELRVGVVGEEEGVLGSKASRQPRVGIAQQRVHVVLVAAHDDRDVLPGGTLHLMR